MIQGDFGCGCRCQSGRPLSLDSTRNCIWPQRSEILFFVLLWQHFGPPGTSFKANSPTESIRSQPQSTNSSKQEESEMSQWLKNLPICFSCFSSPLMMSSLQPNLCTRVQWNNNIRNSSCMEVRLRLHGSLMLRLDCR